MFPKVYENDLIRFLIATALVIFIFLNTDKIYGQNISVLKESSEKRYHTVKIFYVMAGIPLGQSAGDFFSVYGENIGGFKREFETNPVISLGLKLHFWNEFRLGIAASYTTTTFRESFSRRFQEPFQINRTIEESIDIETLPVIFSFEYIPYYRKQFKSYIGLGLGVGINSYLWNESINSDYTADPRESGKKYDEWIFSPAGRMVSGIELGFDKDPGEYIIGSLIFELRYTYMYKQIDIFKNLRDEFPTIPEDLKRKYNIIPGYFSVNTAISFNL